jgi:hypothetical protein
MRSVRPPKDLGRRVGRQVRNFVMQCDGMGSVPAIAVSSFRPSSTWIGSAEISDLAVENPTSAPICWQTSF